MKNLRSLLAVLILTTAVTALTACGNSSSSKPQPADKAPVTTPKAGTKGNDGSPISSTAWCGIVKDEQLGEACQKLTLRADGSFTFTDSPLKEDKKTCDGASPKSVTVQGTWKQYVKEGAITFTLPSDSKDANGLEYSRMYEFDAATKTDPAMLVLSDKTEKVQYKPCSK